MKIAALLIVAALSRCNALTGYDCGKGLPNITTISLIDVGGCEIEQADPIVQPVYIQLLQRAKHLAIPARACKILARQHVRTCGMFSHTMDVPEGESTFLMPMTREACAEVARYGQFKYAQAIIGDIRVNQTTHASAVVTGSLQDNGECQGELFVWRGHQYTAAVVTIDFEITIREFTAILNMDEREINLIAGVVCAYPNGQCMDEEIGYGYWETNPSHVCDFKSYELLFHGPGVKVTDNSTASPDIYFANSTGNIQFGLAKTVSSNICGFNVIHTENPRLFLVEAAREHGVPAKTRLDVENILLSDYFNTKLTYYARHVRTQFGSLYKDIISHRCQLEQRVIKNALAQAHSSPDEFALTVMGQPGFTAVPAGEVMHLLQCTARLCKIRATATCFHELPVACGADELYLRPKTHVLTTRGTPAECSGVLPIMYRINGIWRQHLPKVVEGRQPQVLRPMSRLTWAYQDLENLMNDGIYSPEDLERLHEHVNFPMERPALVEHVARRLAGKDTPGGEVALHNLLDQEAVQSLAQSAMSRVWSKFTQFGIYSAGVIAIVVIFQLIKSLIETLIRGYTLHQIYGWSGRLFGALFSSITHLFARVVHREEAPAVLEIGPPRPARDEDNAVNPPAEAAPRQREMRELRRFLAMRRNNEDRGNGPQP